MPHNPSLAPEIAERILGRFTSLSGANTAAQNGDIATLIGNVAEEISLVDRRYAEFVEAHNFKGTNEALLEERINQLPRHFPKRKPASAATGGAFTLKRTSGAAAITLDAGTVRVAPLQNSSLVFANVNPITFGIGIVQLTASESFVCATPGAAGTVGLGDVSMVLESPNSVITYARNTVGMLGLDLETIAEYARRAERWIYSLSQCQREAVEILMEGFRSSLDPTRIIKAKAWSDIEHPGYSEVYLENGSAMVGFTRLAVPQTGIIPSDVPAGRRHLFHFDYPAATPPKLKITGAALGSIPVIYTVLNGAWVSQEETGQMWIHRNPTQYGLTFTAGDTWETFDHWVYTGLTVEAQKYVEAYCTALGVRIRMRHGSPQYVDITANAVIVPYPGRTRDQIISDIKDSIVAFVQRIGPGDPLILFDLIEALNGKVRGLVNLIFDHGDKYAGGENKKLVTSRARITLR